MKTKFNKSQPSKAWVIFCILAGVVANAGTLAVSIPERGTATTKPAKQWEHAFVSGNGIMGAMVFGRPISETIVVNHCRLFLPLGSREIVPDMAQYLAEVRRIIRDKGYSAAYHFMIEKARQQGMKGLIWTDPFHPGFELKVNMKPDVAEGNISNYLMTENFQTGEVTVSWKDSRGQWFRKLFVSRADSVIVYSIKNTSGSKVNCELSMAPIQHKLINSEIKTDREWIACHNIYVKGKGGYDGVIRVVPGAGKAESDGSKITVTGADELIVLMHIEPWKTPLPDSQAWSYSLKNPEFKKTNTNHIPGIKKSLSSIPADYDKLLKPHAKAHGQIFNRVRLDLGGQADRNRPTDELLEQAAKTKEISPALLERVYDAGRYVYMSSASELPPNLQGIWTGTWKPAWSGDFTLDTNIQLAIDSAYSANMAECMEGFFNLMESFVPDCKLNARRLYGCRGILTNTRASNNCLFLHWGNGWPGQFWTAGAGWFALFFYDYYLYTGDKEFLGNRAVPFMKEAALFYEDFLFIDDSGKYHFSPSYSAENGWADNAAQDIQITRELLTNLISACNELGIERDGIKRWQAILDKLPTYLINEEGALKEWAVPDKGENYKHRHLMHLYGAFQSQEFSEEADPVIWNAAKVALLKRIEHTQNAEQSTHGRMHMGLAAASMGMGNEAYDRIAVMVTKKSMYPSLVTSHEPGQRIFNVDGNGSIPEIINRMIVQSKPARLSLLPALPEALPKGTLTGTRARGQILVDRITWDMNAGKVIALLSSEVEQTITLVMPRDIVVDKITVNDKTRKVIEQGVCKQGCNLTLPKGRTVTIHVQFQP